MCVLVLVLAVMLVYGDDDFVVGVGGGSGGGCDGDGDHCCHGFHICMFDIFFRSHAEIAPKALSNTMV